MKETVRLPTAPASTQSGHCYSSATRTSTKVPRSTRRVNYPTAFTQPSGSSHDSLSSDEDPYYRPEVQVESEKSSRRSSEHASLGAGNISSSRHSGKEWAKEREMKLKGPRGQHHVNRKPRSHHLRGRHMREQTSPTTPKEESKLKKFLKAFAIF